MQKANRVTHIEFEYPIEVKEGENVIVVKKGSFKTYVPIEPGWYFISSNSSKPSGYVPEVDYNLYDAIEKQLQDWRPELTFQIENDILPVLSGGTEDLTFEFSELNWSFDPRLLGYPSTQSTDVLVTGDGVTKTEVISPHSPLGRWVFFTKDSDNTNVSTKSWVEDYRVTPSRDVFVSDGGNLQRQSYFDLKNQATFSLRNVPAPMVWEYANDRVDEWSEVFSGTVATSFDGNPNYALEHLWERLNHSYATPEETFRSELGVLATPFEPYEKATHISIKIFYQEVTSGGDNIQRLRGYVTDINTLNSFWGIISDEDSLPGEKYQVSLPFNVVPYEKEVE